MSEPIQAISQGNYILQAPPASSYMNLSGLEYDGDKISGYAGSAFKAGTDLEFEYDSADNISAINSSAISTTPSQALYAKSPLYAGVSGTSSFIGINSGDLARMLGVDETVLFSGSTQSPNLTDSIWNYKKISLLIGDDTTNTKVSNSQMYYTDDIAAIGSGFSIFQTCKRKDGGYISMGAYINVNNGGSGFTVASVGGWASWDNSTCQYQGAGTWAPRFYKVIGIGRKEA